MRPACSPSSSTDSRSSAASPSTVPSSAAATSSPSRPRTSSSRAIASTDCASASTTSRASPFSSTLIALADQRAQLVLEPARLDRAVDAALLRRVRLPPPATRAQVFTCLRRPRARRAADRGVALVVERVVRKVVLAHVLPDVFLRPFRERVQLHDRAVVMVDLDLADVAARRPLVAPQAGDPRVESREVSLQRQHLSHLAAEQPILDALVEEVRPVLSDHCVHGLRGRREEIELQPRVAVTHLLDQLEGLTRQTPRVDAEHADRGIDRVRHVQEHCSIRLERGRDRERRREPLDRPLEHDLRLFALELDGELPRLEIVQQLDTHAFSFAFAGSRPARRPSWSSVSRSQNIRNVSPSPRASTQPPTSPTTASSSSSVGTRLKAARAIAAGRSRLPRK